MQHAIRFSSKVYVHHIVQTYDKRNLMLNVDVVMFKAFQVFTIKHRRFRLRKCYFGVLTIKYKQSGFSKMLTRFWTANSIKYENTIIGAMKRDTSDLELWKRNTKVGKQGVRFLFTFLKLPNKN